MEEAEQNFVQTNINSLWLQNIFENLKNLEALERLAREGCQSLMEYMQIPYDKKDIILPDIQYKNLRFIISEVILLLTDLTPVVDKERLKKFRSDIDKLEIIMNNRKLFIKEVYTSNNEIKSSKTTEFFYQTLKYLTLLRIDIVQEIAPMLYISAEDTNKKKKEINSW